MALHVFFHRRSCFLKVRPKAGALTKLRCNLQGRVFKWLLNNTLSFQYGRKIIRIV